MGKTHKVRVGECVSSIAFASGHFPGTLWDHPRNAALREQRESMFVLAEGDEVFVPDLRPKEEVRPTDALHRFRRRGVPEKLHLRLVDADDEPLAGVAYTITIGALVLSGETGGDGSVEHYIPPDAKTGTLIFMEGDEERVVPLSLGSLAPLRDEDGALAGVRDRLSNLGFPCQGPGGELDDETRAALLAFQRKHGLPESGEPDDATLDQLEQAHGT